MIRAVVMWMVLGVSSLVSAPAQAGVICSFTGSGTTGVDCLGQTWTLGNGGWGIPGIGLGTRPYAGTITATDFHWRCLAGCGLIDNSAGADTRMQLSPFGATDFWSEALNVAADTIDFTSPGTGLNLTPGRPFFTNITVPISLAAFRFEASWTSIFVPTPASLPLVALALMALVFARRQSRQG